ncbi:MAG: phage integrase SAM-like domain-containing protein [Lewinellaceae bacterium]|nr:phage integrase SAM-like domain-containing protein [Lewinellaceae bacterium]
MQAIRYAVVYDKDKRGELRQDGTAVVLIRAYLNGRTYYHNTGILITPAQWHKKYQRIVHHPNQFALNKTIADLVSRMERFEHEVMHRDGQVSLERLREYMQTGSRSETFTDFFREQLEKERGRLAPSSHLDQANTFRKLQEFRDPAYFSDLKPSFVQEFVQGLYNAGLVQNTVHKHFKNLRKYINLAVRHNRLSANPCNQVKVRPAQTDKLFLTEHELGLFERFDTSKKDHHPALLDFFLFSCYTGLRFSDISKIKDDHILETPDGIELFLTAQKTKKPYRQNLRKLFPHPDGGSSRPERIIQRRLRSFYIDGPIFHYTCRNAYVKQLKKIARQLPVRKRVQDEIASHTGRHTFGAIMAGKIDVHILKELMQHSNLRETMIYVHMNRGMINRALDGVDWD